MPREVLLALQTLLVAGGIYLFLRFVRVTRGSRLIRGLFLTLVVGIAGLWTLSRLLDLGELEFLITRAVPFVLITFAVVFQPELRRAMAQLGERSLVGRLISRSREDTLARIVRAARAMAHRRHGALIAFEREASLNTYIEAGTQLDARVTARLLESLFNPSGPLHDGAVIVRKDRLAAAGCFFPLPQEADIDPSLGTRHRSAVGITEEADAVVLVVSEETGTISLARDGKIRTRIPEEELQAALEEWLEKRTLDEDAKRPRTAIFNREEVFALSASLAIAAGLLFFAHQNLLVTKPATIRVVGVTPSERRAPAPNEILVVLPDENQRLLAPDASERLDLLLTGSRAELERVEEDLSGMFVVQDDAWEGGPLDLTAVEWSDDSWMLGVDVVWADSDAPELSVLRYATREVELDKDAFRLLVDAVNPNYFADEDTTELQPSAVVSVRGPASALADLEALRERLSFEPVRLRADHVGRGNYPVRLSRAALDAGFELQGDEIRLSVEVLPQERDIGTVTAEVAIVCFDPARADEVGRWSLPPNFETARFTIKTQGLFATDADLGTPAMIEQVRSIRQAVERSLNVYVDLAELPPQGGGSTLSVRTSWRTDPVELLSQLNIEVPRLGARRPLFVQLESEASVLLSPETP